MSLRARLLLAFLGVTLLALITYAGLALWMVRDSQQQQALAVLARLAESLKEQGRLPKTDIAQALPLPDAVIHRVPGQDHYEILRPADSRLTDIETVNALLSRLPKNRDRGLIEAAGEPFYWVRRQDARQGEWLLLLHAEGLAGLGSHHTLQMRLFVAGLAVLWIAAWVALIVSGHIVQRFEAQQVALEHLALHDELTGLPNRTLFADRLDAALRLAQRNQGGLALLLIDLDRFKEINDTLGHHYGDELLKEVGKRLRSVLRESDTVARLGGDEFAIVLPGAGAEAAIRCARRILEACGRSVEIQGLRLEARPSIGIAFHPEHGANPDALLRHADVAMYQAKREGSGFAVYEQETDPHNLRRLTMLNELGSAAEKSQLRLHYQPLLDLRTGRIAGAEALVRWAHPELGMLSAADFIELAEQHGLIGVITSWVLEQAIRQAAEWERLGHELFVAVNLSAHDLQDRHLPERLQRLLQQHALPPERLELEITESAVMRDFERGLEVCHHIDRLGVRLAIDDFGAGMSSLRYLRQLPAQTLKIDRSFVIDMAEDENNAVIVRSIVDLAHNIGRRVVAEGVQNADALLVLQVLRCDLAQGHFIHPPSDAETLVAWLRERETAHRQERA